VEDHVELWWLPAIFARHRSSPIAIRRRRPTFTRTSHHRSTSTYKYKPSPTMHRRPAASATSSKVAASRERRARRGDKLNSGGGIRNINGHLPLHTKQQPEKKGAGVGKYILLGLVLLLVILINHFTSNSASSTDGNDGGRWNLKKVSKNALKRMRNGKSIHHSYDSIAADADAANSSPYTVEALRKNPYLGWQPPIVPSPPGSTFSWRDCFKADPKSDGTGQPGK
jgi:hypothetical protein